MLGIGVLRPAPRPGRSPEHAARFFAGLRPQDYLDLNWRGVAAIGPRAYARVPGARFYSEFMDPRSWPAHMRPGGASALREEIIR